jgi:hypothetical protein
MRFSLLVSLFLLMVYPLGCADNATDPPETPGPEEVEFASAAEILPLIQRGINLGNTFEPPEEGGWNNGPAEEYYFDDYKSAGFTCVRVPVRWGTHTSDEPPYTVDPMYMDRVEQVVDWGLDRGLFIILNAHHEEWLKQDYSRPNQDRFDSIWVQIATRFADRSQYLMFEMINEPHGLTVEQVDSLNSRILPIIRAKNPNRFVIFSGNDWSNLEHLLTAAVPVDEYLLGYYHSYDPWDFAGLANGTWGEEADIAAVAEKFARAAQWTAETGIPVIISEFGAVHQCDYNSRMRHYATYVEEALKNNIPFQVWDDGGNFGIYDRANRSWPEVKDILIHTSPDGPTNLRASYRVDMKVLLLWENRVETADRLIIQRRANYGEFIDVAEVTANTPAWLDAELSPATIYDYRIIAQYDDEEDRYSCPVRVEVP